MKPYNPFAIAGLGLVLMLPTSAARGKNQPAVAEKIPTTTRSLTKGIDNQLPWLESLAAGYRRSLTHQNPILVRVGGEACPWCRLLDLEVAKPAVQAELAGWTLVSLDVEKSSDEVRPLGVGPIPALRVLSPRGRLIAAHEGYLSAEDLVAWLRKHHGEAQAQPNDSLLAAGPPNLISVLRLIKQFEDRNATIREAAVRRLLPYPGVARDPVMKAFREGNLLVKLTALELLADWKAPVESLDPWRPETLSKEGLAALEKWSRESTLETLVLSPQPLSQALLEEARADMGRMLAAPVDEVPAMRERLARLGEPLLPEVTRQLHNAATDETRERLLALRYRLVADDLLVLRWPGGLERLAHTDVSLRRKAAEELAKMAAASDQRLLLELFRDADPLVREICLRGLRAVGGKEATAALVNLLSDPEPNIRAAVLKQLAEKPSADLIDDVARYAQTETDADLLVHAIRFFRETGNDAVIEHLLPLLEHAGWQVRAEAVEAIAKIVEDDRDLRQEAGRESSEIYQRMLKMLEDPDSFVVAKTLEFLELVDAASAVKPLVAAGGKHPTLIPRITKILGSKVSMREEALPYLKQSFQSDSPSVRAAALEGLFLADQAGSKEFLPRALADESPEVRIAAANSLLNLLNELRPELDKLAKQQVEELAESPPAEESVFQKMIKSFRGPRASAPAIAEKPRKDAGESLSAWDQWLTAFARGEERPAWMETLVMPLEKMLASPHPREQVIAGLVLVALGKSEAAVPVLLKAAGEHRDVYAEATRVLAWLPFAQRKAVFQQLAEMARNLAELEALAANLNVIVDQRSAELMYDLLDRDEATLGLAESIRDQLLRLYYGQRYWDPSSLTPNARRKIAESVKPRAQSGSSLARLVAISFLMSNAPAEAAEVAQGLLTDDSVDPALRADAFQILLIAQPESDRMATVLEALRQQSPDKRKVALAYLALGNSALNTLRGSGFQIDRLGELLGRSTSSGEGRPIIPDPPRRLSLADVKPLIDNNDPEISAFAGYLAALFADGEGLPALLGHWRSRAEPDAEWDRLMYRAIAALDDPEHIPVLKEIYARRESSRLDLADFYWTIRIMSGPEILGFRKQLRDEAGPDILGNSRGFLRDGF